MKEKIFYILATACLTMAIFFTILALDQATYDIGYLRFLIYAGVLYILTFIFYRKGIKLEEAKNE
jgi:predicted membrane channel-forming protein YqfA (hemolysin III family)